MSAFERSTNPFFLVGQILQDVSTFRDPDLLSLREYLPNIHLLPLSVFLLDNNFMNLVKFTVIFLKAQKYSLKRT